MSTSKTFQQSLAEAGSETRPPMLERGSYIPWASRFKRFLNRKRENRKWLLKALEDGPYVFRNITPTGSALPRLQDVEDLQGDDLLYYDAEMELTNMILLYIPNEIYNSKLVNASRAKKLEKSHDPLALVAYTGLSSRNTSSYYVTHPSSVVDYDEEFKKDDVHNHSEDPLASNMLLLAKSITQNFSNPTNNRLRASSNTRYQAVVQGDRMNIQIKNSGNVGRNNRRAYVQGEVVEGMNATNETANVQRIVRTPDKVSREFYLKKLIVKIVIIMAQRLQAADVHQDELCPPNKRYDIMDANKKVDLENFWHTLREDGSKYRLKFMLDRKELTFTLDDFRTIFHLLVNVEGIYYSLHHPATSIPYPRFTKIIISHYMTISPDISRRARDAYHNLQDDDIMKNIFNSRRNKNKVFRLDVPLIQSQPTESTQGTHRTLSAPRSPNPATETAESNMIQVSLAEQKSHEEKEARENVAQVAQHLAVEEIEKLVEESENVDDSSPTRHDDTSFPDTRIEPRSNKESPEVEIDQEKEEETTKDTEVEQNIIIPVNVDDEEDEITDEVFNLRRRAKGKNVEESRISPIPSPTRSPRNLSTLGSSDTKKLQELTVTHPTPSSGRYGYLFAHLKKRFMPRTSSDQLADNLHDVMMETLPSLVKEKVTEQVKKEVPVYLAEGLILERKSTKEETERLIAKAILQERGHMQAQISSQIQNAIDNAIPSLVDASVRNYMSGHILHVHPAQVHSSSIPEQQHQLYLAIKADPLLQQQDISIWLALKMKFEKTQVPHTACRPSAVGPRDQDDPHDDAHPEGRVVQKGNQEQDDEFDFWTDSYASDDDEIPTKQVSQDIMEEISLTIDEAKLKKMADEMLRQRCTLGDEHYCQRDPEAPVLSLINQDLLYLKKGNLGPEKIVLSLHKFLAIVFNDDDIEERTSKWVNKRQKEPGRPKEEIYSNSKIVQVIKTFWELGHEHKFITEIVARRANDCIVSITKPDYKNFNKNDIEDMYLLIMNNKVPDYADTGLLWSLSVFIRSSVIWERVHDFQLGIESYQQKINLTAPTITFTRIEECDVFSIVYEPVHGIIYTNSQKERRVMRPSEIHKFCDATLGRTLEGLKSYYNDVKYGYVQKELTHDELEFLKLFEEEIEVRSKYQDQMKRWEMYMNGRLLGLRRERPE
ncbi:hypothetical protein Tco_0163503 [Tanacetum coccineum]